MKDHLRKENKEKAKKKTETREKKKVEWELSETSKNKDLNEDNGQK